MTCDPETKQLPWQHETCSEEWLQDLGLQSSITEDLAKYMKICTRGREGDVPYMEEKPWCLRCHQWGAYFLTRTIEGLCQKAFKLPSRVMGFSSVRKALTPIPDDQEMEFKSTWTKALTHRSNQMMKGGGSQVGGCPSVGACGPKWHKHH